METWIRLRQYTVVCGMVTYSNIPKMVLRVRNERKKNDFFFTIYDYAWIRNSFVCASFTIRVEMAKYIYMAYGIWRDTTESIIVIIIWLLKIREIKLLRAVIWSVLDCLTLTWRLSLSLPWIRTETVTWSVVITLLTTRVSSRWQHTTPKWTNFEWAKGVDQPTSHESAWARNEIIIFNSTIDGIVILSVAHGRRNERKRVTVTDWVASHIYDSNWV